MKKILFIVGLFVLFVSCHRPKEVHSDEDGVLSSLELQDLRGPVKNYYEIEQRMVHPELFEAFEIEDLVDYQVQLSAYLQQNEANNPEDFYYSMEPLEYLADIEEPYTFTEYDERGDMLAWYSLYDESNVANYTTYTYDAQRRVTEMIRTNAETNQKKTSRFVYDEQGNTVVEEQVDELDGELISSSRTEREYTAGNQLLSQKDYEEGQLFGEGTYKYDESGRLVRKVYLPTAGPQTVYTYSYDDAGRVKESVYYRQGQLVWREMTNYASDESEKVMTTLGEKGDTLNVQTITYRGDKVISMHSTNGKRFTDKQYAYDAEGHEIRYTRTESYGRYECRERTYNKRGDMTRESIYSEPEKMTQIQTFSYTKQGVLEETRHYVALSKESGSPEHLVWYETYSRDEYDNMTEHNTYYLLDDGRAVLVNRVSWVYEYQSSNRQS